MEGPKVVFTINIFGGIDITETVVIGWGIILFVFLLCLFLTRNLKKIPTTKRQVVAEIIVEFVNKTVKQTMGEKFAYYAPYIATLMLYAILGALVSLFGLRPMTADINVTLCWALITFVLITYNKLKTNGGLGYAKSFAEPVAFIAPLNIISEIATPMSMAFRMFGNVAGGMVITSILYMALGGLSSLIHASWTLGPLTLNLAQVFTPAIFSLYFDLFSGCVQAYIFAMLTMVNISIAAEK